MTPFFITVGSAILIFLVNLVALGLVPERRRPSSAMAWLLVIFLVPVFGLLFFLLIGRSHVPRKRREEQLQVGEVIQSSLTTVPALPARRSDRTGSTRPWSSTGGSAGCRACRGRRRGNNHLHASNMDIRSFNSTSGEVQGHSGPKSPRPG
jgi:hypothetical protein